MAVEQGTSSTRQALEEMFRQAKNGELTFESMASTLGVILAAKNYPLAALLYTTWYRNRHGDVRVSQGLLDMFVPIWTQLKAQQPDIPELPSAVGWLKWEVAGQMRDYHDIDDPFFIDILGRVAKHTITMLEGPEPPWVMYKAIEYLVKNNIPGDLVECGVWNGGSVLLMALALQHFGDTSRRIWLYDTFEGMPKPQDVDRNWDGASALPVWEEKKQNDPSGPNWGFGGSLEQVREIVFGSGYPKENFIFVKGMVEDTIPGQMPNQIALLRLDTDFYASTYHELQHLYPPLAPAGVLIIDDYGYFQGARIATDQYLQEQSLPLFLNRVTQSVRLAIKPESSAAAGAAVSRALRPGEEVSYRLDGDFSACPMATLLQRSFSQALALDHKLPDEVLAMRGMSGRKYRYLINRFIEQLSDARYLEVGSWAGSTICAAAYGNVLKGLCIDNWSEFGGPKAAFFANVDKVRSAQAVIDFIESDFRAVNYADIGQFNVYLFDGPHAEQDQYDGVVIALPALDSVFALIVDDWNWSAVRKGTQRALRDSGLDVLCSIEVRTTQDDGTPGELLFERSEWHNGYFVAICQKRERE